MSDFSASKGFWRSLWPVFAVFLTVDALLVLLFYLTLAPARHEPVSLSIPSGSSVNRIARTLEENRVIKDRLSFRLLVRMRGMSRELRAGSYEFPAGVTPWQVIDILATGQGEMVRVTLPEGLTDSQVFARLTAALPHLDSLRLKRLSHGDSLARRLGIEAPNLTGYLFPETYFVSPRISEPEILVLMANRFRQVWAGLERVRPDAGRLDAHENVILASIIEKEAVHDSERPVIASVFLNRLQLGRPLESCATVLFVLGKHKSRLLYRDLEVQSPYNTYLNSGLPPGPICNPGEASLRAALFPAETDYLYFVARGDGSHVFSRSLNEHINAKNRIGRSGPGG